MPPPSLPPARAPRAARRGQASAPSEPSLAALAAEVHAAATQGGALRAILDSLLGAGFGGAAFHELDAVRERCVLAGWGGDAGVGSPAWDRRLARAAGPLPSLSAVPAGGSVPGEVESALGSAALALAPARSRGRLMGVLAADTPRLTREQVAALGTAAALLGPVWESWRLDGENRTRAEALLAVQRIGREMTASLDAGGLLSTVAEEARRFSGAEGALLYLADPGGERLRLEAWAGEPPPPGRETLAVGYGIPGWVAERGEVLRVSDRGAGGKSPATRRSQLAVPLLSEGKVVGVLALDSPREEAFTESHEEIVGIFASQAAKAIEAARLFEGLRQERDLRDAILSGTPNGVLAVGRDRRIVWTNASARQVVGSEEEPEGKPVERYLGDEGFSDALGRLLAGEAGREEVAVSSGAGLRARHLLLSLFPLRLGDQPGAGIVVQDLTERRRLDEQVQRMARLASLGQLAAGIAHEIRNPLTGVGITLDLLREQESLSEGGRGLVDDIAGEIDRLELLIRGILDFARPRPLGTRRMSIARALEWHRTFQEQCLKKGVGFTLEQAGNPKVVGDPEKLIQLFLNIALNALEATAPGGEIRIAASTVPDAAPRVRVTVEDTGRGMDEETLSQVFNPFFTTRSDGTGLGLAIAHSIAEQHGGRIEVESAPGVGTRFTVELPGLEEFEPEPPSAAEGEGPAAPERTRAWRAS